jgi:acyl carrier protein
MFETFKELLVTELHVIADDVTPETELIGDLGINSIELADLVYRLEETFNVVIENEDLQNFVTVGDVVRYLEANS